jgi:hypothetical protein
MKLLKFIVNKFPEFRVIKLLIFYSILLTQICSNYIIANCGKKFATNHIIRNLKLLGKKSLNFIVTTMNLSN